MDQGKKSLVYCLMNDLPACAVIKALREFKTKRKKAELANSNRATCGWAWDGGLHVKGRPNDIPMAVAMIRQELDLESALDTGLGFLTGEKLFVCSDLDRDRTGKLMAFCLADKPKAIVLNIQRSNADVLVATQIIDTFLVHPPIKSKDEGKSKNAPVVFAPHVYQPYFVHL